MIPPPETGFKIESKVMLEVLQELYDYAYHGRGCIIYGPSGSGKEFAALYYWQIYRYERKGLTVPFLKLDCYGLDVDRARSELFGHAKGAFPGTVSEKEGLLTKARGGILFLDEVAALPEEIQAQLVSALDPGIQAVRSLTSDPADSGGAVTILAATERKPDKLIVPFRMHLGKEVLIPDVSQRQNDVPNAVRYFTKQSINKLRNRERFLCQIYGCTEASEIETPANYDPVSYLAEKITTRLSVDMERQVWPGNLRQICNALDSAIVRAKRLTGFEAFLEDIMYYYRNYLNQQNSLFDPLPTGRQAWPSADPTILEQIRDIFPRIAEAEQTEWASALSRMKGKRNFMRTDIEQFVHAGRRTIQQRLKILENQGLIRREGKKKEKYVLVSKIETATIPVFALPHKTTHYWTYAHKEKTGSIFEILANTRCLFISGERNELKGSFVESICHQLTSEYTVFYHHFDDGGMGEFIDKVTYLLEKEQIVDTGEVSDLKDRTEILEMLNPLVNRWAEKQENPLFFLDNTDSLRSTEDLALLKVIIDTWTGFTFILEGTKMAVDLSRDDNAGPLEFPF
ncbi:MAG: sigma 54-interacting transcriptional regulator [Saprospiraceae bacterium]|nr:sigma 54-interacting transcriptional regulator [Saprospiraceae bacterium]